MGEENMPTYAKKGAIKKPKGGIDRRIKNKAILFEDNMYERMEGKDIPKSRKPEKTEMPVSPAVLGLCLFLVIGSAFFQILQTSQQSQTVE